MSWLFALPREHFLAYGSAVAEDVIENAPPEREVLKNEGTVEENIRDAFRPYEVFWGVGHGLPDTFTLECKEVFLKTGPKPIGLRTMGGRFVHLLSCLAGRQLGPDLIERGGAEAFLGYTEKFALGVKKEGAPRPEPGESPTPEADFYTFCSCDLEVQRKLLRGKSAREAQEASQDKFEEEIRRYETGDRSDWYIAPHAARMLLHDKDAQVMITTEEVRPAAGVDRRLIAGAGAVFVPLALLGRSAWTGAEPIP